MRVQINPPLSRTPANHLINKFQIYESTGVHNKFQSDCGRDYRPYSPTWTWPPLTAGSERTTQHQATDTFSIASIIFHLPWTACSDEIGLGNVYRLRKIYCKLTTETNERNEAHYVAYAHNSCTTIF